MSTLLSKLSIVAIAVAGLIAVPAMAQPTPNGEIDVNVDVQPFCEVEVIDGSMTFESDGTSPNNNDLSGIGNEPGVHRARFEVRANQSYNLTVTSQNGVWQAYNLLPSPYGSYKQAKFESQDGGYIGGSLYLDRDWDQGTVTHLWDGDAGNLVTDSYDAEVHTWGLSAAFAPGLYEDGDGEGGGEEDQDAPPATYSNTAVITASLTE